MDDRDGTVDGLQTAQDRQHDRVVASEADDARVLPAICKSQHEGEDGDSGGKGVGPWGEAPTLLRCRMVEDLAISLLHLLKGMGSIEWGDGHVATVNLGGWSAKRECGCVLFWGLLGNLQSPGLAHRDPPPRRCCSSVPSSRARSRHGCLWGRSGRQADRTSMCHRGSPGWPHLGADCGGGGG